MREAEAQIRKLRENINKSKIESWRDYGKRLFWAESEHQRNEELVEQNRVLKGALQKYANTADVREGTRGRLKTGQSPGEGTHSLDADQELRDLRDKHENLVRRCENMQRSYDTLQQKYRKEREIWKLWIERYDQARKKTLSTNRSPAVTIASGEPSSMVPAPTAPAIRSPAIVTASVAETSVPASTGPLRDKPQAVNTPRDRVSPPQNLKRKRLSKSESVKTPETSPDQLQVVRIDSRRDKSINMLTDLSMAYESVSASQKIIKHEYDETDSSACGMHEAVVPERPEKLAAIDPSEPESGAIVKVESQHEVYELMSSQSDLTCEKPKSTQFIPRPAHESAAGNHTTFQGRDNTRGKYALDGVVRRKDDRKMLHADGCPCCSKFYSMAGPSHVSAGPMWRSPPRDHQVRRSQSTTTLQQVGRHRANWRRSPTPPGFWDTGFPTTQEVAQEKRQNELRRSRKSLQLIATSSTTDKKRRL